MARLVMPRIPMAEMVGMEASQAPSRVMAVTEAVQVDLTPSLVLQVLMVQPPHPEVTAGRAGPARPPRSRP